MTRRTRRPSTRWLVFSGLVVALLLAGVASYYASSRPDGLTHVAESAGFAGQARDPATADSPLAGYRTAGVDNARLSGGVAGVAGTLVVLLLGGGLFWGLRRRSAAGPADAPADAHPADRPSVHERGA